jgi:ketosteroid isomerase-like protein
MNADDPIALVRAAWEAAERDGMRALLGFVAEDVTWMPLLAHLDVLHGRAEVERFGRELRRERTEVTISGDAFECRGDHVLVSGRVRVYSRNGHFDEPRHWRVDVRGGRIARVATARRRSELDAAT